MPVTKHRFIAFTANKSNVGKYQFATPFTFGFQTVILLHTSV